MKVAVFLPICGRAASSETLMGAAQHAERLGFALQFMAPRYPDRLGQIERFGQEVLPALH
ncbi:MAG: hypothetical protein HY695_18055 [Deltaproteobacteria bacterium]|nr:hypothetical protein [Deltaproteobacteria bacterium]